MVLQLALDDTTQHNRMCRHERLCPNNIWAAPQKPS